MHAIQRLHMEKGDAYPVAPLQDVMEREVNEPVQRRVCAKTSASSHLTVPDFVSSRKAILKEPDEGEDQLEELREAGLESDDIENINPIIGRRKFRSQTSDNMDR